MEHTLSLLIIMMVVGVAVFWLVRSSKNNPAKDLMTSQIELDTELTKSLKVIYMAMDAINESQKKQVEDLNAMVDNLKDMNKTLDETKDLIKIIKDNS